MLLMKLHDAITINIRHVQQNRLRSGLSILGILIGITSVLCMIAIGRGAQKIIADDLDKIGGPNQVQFWTRIIYKRKGKWRKTTERYTRFDADAIEAECPDVLMVLPTNSRYHRWVTARQGRQTRAYIEGMTAAHAYSTRSDVHHGRFLSENDIDAATQVCVLGANIATELFGETSPVGEEVKIRIGHQTVVRCRVIGVMVAKGNQLSNVRSLDNIIYVPLTTHQQRFTGINSIERLIIFFQEDADVYRVIDDVKAVLRERHRGTDNFTGTWIPKRTVKRLEHIEKVIKIALGGIAGFSLFVSGIGIMNICLVSVGEKTREIGLRKSGGAKRIDIFYQFLTESICLCLCGGILGIVGGWLFAHGMARVAVRILPIVDVWPVVLSVRWIAISVLFSIFMGITFGVYPAVRASRMSPIDALRTDT